MITFLFTGLFLACNKPSGKSDETMASALGPKVNPDIFSVRSESGLQTHVHAGSRFYIKHDVNLCIFSFTMFIREGISLGK